MKSICICFTTSLPHLSKLTVLHFPLIHLLFLSTCKGGNPLHVFNSPLPPRSPILLPSSNIHPLSLSFRDHYYRANDWPEHYDGCMMLLFQMFLLYLCIIHYYPNLLKESVLKHHDFLHSVFIFSFFELVLLLD